MASFGADAHTANPDSEVEIVVSFRCHYISVIGGYKK